MIYNFLRFPEGKSKAFTMSYDDGHNSDIRFLDIINKHNLKCTFNLVGSHIDEGFGITKDFIKQNILAKGHEIANHGYYHRAQDSIRPIERMVETLNSRLTLEREFDLIVRGMAFPDRSVNRFIKPATYNEVKNQLVELGIAYCRCTGMDNDNFELPEDWHNWYPSAHHNNLELMNMADKFVSIDVDGAYISRRFSKVFFVWGHSFEFDRDQNWHVIENLCDRISGIDDIWYATCIDIYNYVNAYKSLIYSADSARVYNPTLHEVWFDIDGKLHHIKPGETIIL